MVDPLKAGKVRKLAFSHNGQILAACSLDYDALNAGSSDYDIFTLWNATTSQQLPNLPEDHPELTVSLAFHPLEPILAVGDSEGAVRLWDLVTPEQPKRLKEFSKGSNKVYSLAFSYDGQILAAGDSKSVIRM
jgi:WD40 repeat protein